MTTRLSRRSFQTTSAALQQGDMIQKLYLDALRSYRPTETLEKPDLAEKFEAPKPPAIPPVEIPEVLEAQDDADIVLVNEADFPPYLDPCEDPNDYDAWWDYTVDYDVYPYSQNKPARPATHLHEAE